MATICSPRTAMLEEGSAGAAADPDGELRVGWG